MAPSLASKLKDLRKKLKPTVKPCMLLTFENIRLIARYMPETKDELLKLIPESFVGLYGDRILDVTVAHERDRDKYDDCVKEIGAFVRGGLPGMEVLNRVYPQILKHFDMEDERDDMFDACKVSLCADQKTLKSIAQAEEEFEFRHASQM
jgi:hypothetical protein